MKSCAICGSHAFNMATEGVNQGAFCDRHYWQRKAEALEAARATPALPQGDAEQLAREFHATYERLAPQYWYETRAETRAFDAGSPNGRLMIAVCREIKARSQALPQDDSNSTDGYAEGWSAARRAMLNGAFETKVPQVPEGMAIVPVELLERLLQENYLHPDESDACVALVAIIEDKP